MDLLVFLIAAGLGVLLSARVRGTRLWLPVSVLFGAVALFGGTDSLARMAALQGNTRLADQLMLVSGTATGLSIPALFHFFTSYPRLLSDRKLRLFVTGLYFLGVAYAVLLPTAIMYETPPSTTAPTVYGPLFWPLNYSLTAALLAGTAWTGYLALKGKTDTERKVGRALTLSVVIPLLVYGAFTASGVQALAGVSAIALYYLIFTSAMAAILYSRTIEPPMPSTFRTLVDSVDEGVIVVDGKGRVSSTNPAARRLLGLSDAPPSQEDAAALFVRVFGDAEQASFIERTLMGVQRGRIESHEGTLENAGARKLTLRWRVFPLGRRDASGEAEGALLMLRDETRRAALEKSTEQARDVLDLVIRMLGHDLKAPLTVLQGYLDLDRMRLDASSDPATAAKVKADMDRMGEAVVGMHMMMGNARALSRLAATGGEGPELVEVDLTKLVGQAIDLLAPVAMSRQIKVERHIEAGVRLKTVPGFDSVPRNLVDNAIKYTPPGGTVAVSLAKAGDSIRLKVADTGQGIPPEKKDQLFKKFERLGAERGPAEGHGLGLSIVAKLVELSGGKIEAAEREDGKAGAVFIVDLPAVRP